MLPQNNFWIQLFQRLASDNPTFFKWIQLASAIIAAVTGLPPLFDFLGIHLPDAWVALQNVVVAKMALVSMLIAQLPKKDDPPKDKKPNDDSGDASLVGGRPGDRQP